MSSTSRTLSGKRIAITGAGRGIGLATATELHRRGASVVIGDIDLDIAKQAAEFISDDVIDGRPVVVMSTDFTEAGGSTG
ncbi:MAG: SDR family NAD(P)-dependent oxidoreductase [Actinomycetota bacterium]|nr:SDR family NAD(P)-dependent oxidoreductase [Actinomycetota bacterium]